MPILLEDLNFPKDLNLDILIQNMPERKMRSILGEYKHSNLQDRRITLPSLKCMKKVLCHYFYSRVVNGTMTWDEIKGHIRQMCQTLESVGMTKKQVKKQFFQREKEIAREKL